MCVQDTVTDDHWGPKTNVKSKLSLLLVASVTVTDDDCATVRSTPRLTKILFTAEKLLKLNFSHGKSTRVVTIRHIVTVTYDSDSIASLSQYSSLGLSLVAAESWTAVLDCRWQLELTTLTQ